MAARRSGPAGYDVYIWIDVDCWVQKWATVDWLIQGASNSVLCITAELDRAYLQFCGQSVLFDWANRTHETFFGETVASRLRNFAVLNSGVFALRRDSSLWALWDQNMRDALLINYDFFAKKFSLNKAVYTEDFPRNILPTTCNWLANHGLILFNAETSTFAEPNLPRLPLGIIHLPGGSKNKEHHIQVLDRGTLMKTNLRFSPSRRDKPAPDASLIKAAGS